MADDVIARVRILRDEMDAANALTDGDRAALDALLAVAEAARAAMCWQAEYGTLNMRDSVHPVRLLEAGRNLGTAMNALRTAVAALGGGEGS